MFSNVILPFFTIFLSVSLPSHASSSSLSSSADTFNTNDVLDNSALHKASSGSIAKRYISRPSIIGGKEAELGRYPYMVSLLSEEGLGEGRGRACGGALVHPLWVLTAAHCAYVEEELYEAAVQDGERRDFSSINHTLTAAVLSHHESPYVLIPERFEYVAIDDVVTHPNWDGIGGAYDVVMVKLKRESLSSVVVNVGDIPRDVSGLSVTTIGWGVITPPLPITEESGLDDYAGTLQELEMDTVGYKACNEQWDSYFNSAFGTTDTGTSYGVVDEFMMCAKAEDGTVCTGDSGGPLIIRGSTPADDVLVGVSSFVPLGCTNRAPAVFTWVSILRPWIHQTIVGATDSPSTEPTPSPSVAPSMAPTIQKKFIEMIPFITIVFSPIAASVYLLYITV